jgi:hypothetical protein
MASGNGGMFGETGASRPIHKGFVQPGHQKDVLRAFRAKSMKARSDQGAILASSERSSLPAMLASPLQSLNANVPDCRSPRCS